MAKQIKTIQCPQCGSAQQSQIKEDHYKCGSCGAEYFLDSDDINVNITHKSQPNLQAQQLTKAIIIVAVVIGIIITITTIFSTSNQRNRTSYTPPIKAEKVKKKVYKERIKFYTLSNTGNSVLFYITDRTYDRRDGTDNNGYYIVFYDYLNAKILKEERLNEEIKLGSNFEYSHLPAVNRDFVLINQRKIYELNFSNTSFNDVSVELLADHNEFSSGIASAKFIYKPRGEGFVLISNMGKEFYFVPSFNKLYKKDDFYNDASRGIKSLSPNAKNKTYYTFTGSSTDYPESEISLLKIVYKYNNGGPEDKELSPRWRKQYPYSGIIYSNTPFKKILIDKDRARVLSYEDITPNRTYFSPQILFDSNDNNLLISFKPTISPDEKTQIQLLNLDTKEPIWTVTTSERIDSKQVVKTKKHYIVPIGSSKLLKIDLDGKEMEYLEISNEREY